MKTSVIFHLKLRMLFISVFHIRIRISPLQIVADNTKRKIKWRIWFHTFFSFKNSTKLTIWRQGWFSFFLFFSKPIPNLLFHPGKFLEHIFPIYLRRCNLQHSNATLVIFYGHSLTTAHLRRITAITPCPVGVKDISIIYCTMAFN